MNKKMKRIKRYILFLIIISFSYVDDSIEPLWNASQNDKCIDQIINLGGIKETSINDAASILQGVIGGGDIVNLEARHEVKHSIPTFQKSVDILGFEHRTDLEDGLRIMWEWAKEQPIRERFVWPSYELDRGIYSYWK